jgi:hypothetical protein
MGSLAESSPPRNSWREFSGKIILPLDVGFFYTATVPQIRPGPASFTEPVNQIIHLAISPFETFSADPRSTFNFRALRFVCQSRCQVTVIRYRASVRFFWEGGTRSLEQGGKRWRDSGSIPPCRNGLCKLPSEVAALIYVNVHTAAPEIGIFRICL